MPSAARLAKGKRAGYDAQGIHDWGAQFLYQQKFAVPKGVHSIQRMRRLLAAALGYQFSETISITELCDENSRAQRFTPRPYLVFVHSTSWASKIWPEHYWAELTRLAGDGFYVLLPWGDESERRRSISY